MSSKRGLGKWFSDMPLVLEPTLRPSVKSGSMRAIAAGQSDVGRERPHNEDRFVLLPEFNVFVVADGMGGHQAGEVASRMAASAIAKWFRENGVGASRSVGERLLLAVADANAAIFARADDSRHHRGMGTTIVAAALCPS